jgi:hypothetical protein
LTLDAGYNGDAVVETLRKGGPDAISLFLQVGIDLNRSGGISAVNGWIKQGLSVLPETERCALVAMLIEVLAENYDLEFYDETGQLH